MISSRHCPSPQLASTRGSSPLRQLAAAAATANDLDELDAVLATVVQGWLA